MEQDSAEWQRDEMSTDGVESQLQAMGPYATRICTAMVYLGKAVELALNMRDIKVIEEMKTVCGEIFEQAETILNSDTRNIQ